jgi:hypothetical protein
MVVFSCKSIEKNSCRRNRNIKNIHIIAFTENLNLNEEGNPVFVFCAFRIYDYLCKVDSMDRNTRYIVRLIFRNKIYSCDGTAFEAFFSQIMQCHNPNFRQVKPQGQYGDRKNDGFDSATGTYY